VAGIAVVITALLIYNVIADTVVNGYDGYPTTLGLLGVLGGLLGIHSVFRK
jgi:hypothetical protein